MEINKDIVFFSADTHFCHHNILKYCNRPFMSPEEQEIVDGYRNGTVDFKEYKRLIISDESMEKHDETIINNWNKKVPKNGIVYFLGDFCFNSNKAPKIINRLNGVIYLVRGNHDRNTKFFKEKFGWIKDYFLLKVKDENSENDFRKIALSHFAMRVWDGSHYGNYHCYGHSHGTLPEDDSTLSTDVGVDDWGFCPVSYNEIVELMSRRTYKNFDIKDCCDNKKIKKAISS